jgi:hypothetical protein
MGPFLKTDKLGRFLKNGQIEKIKKQKLRIAHSANALRLHKNYVFECGTFKDRGF